MIYARFHASAIAPRVTLRLLAALLAVLVIGPSLARAQGDLAAENEKLKAEVAELTVQRDALAQRVRDLNNEITKLRAEVVKLQKSTGAPAPTGTPGATPGSTAPMPVASGKDPFQSPDALFANLQSEYQEKFGAMPRDSRSDLLKYQREVASWARSAQRDRRGPIEWTISIVEPNAANERPARLVFQVLDPASGQPISQPASVLVPSRWSRDVAGASAGDKWKLSATLSANPTFNAQREAAGTPDEPRFIGPFAEFGFDLAITNLVPAK